MAKSLVLTIPILYIASLAQTSFLVHFNIPGFLLNLILILVVLINLFQKAENYSGILSAVFGGFFLDIFSGWPIGSWILILVLISIFIKKIFKDYVRVPSVSGGR